jgi:2-haloalkanoic acid dehalogenase type II
LVAKYKYLTFDCYGTLVDWRTGIEQELRATLGDIPMGGQELMKAYVAAEAEQESTYRKYREVLARTATALSTRLGTHVSEAQAKEFASSVPDWPAFPDTARFLKDMGSQGYKRYILSNVDDDLLEETIRKQSLEVDGFVTAEQVGSYKPKPGHWLEFLRRTGATKQDVLHVAQSLFHDVLPTQGLGIESAWVNRYGEQLPSNASPSVISDSLGNLAATLT